MCVDSKILPTYMTDCLPVFRLSRKHFPSSSANYSNRLYQYKADIPASFFNPTPFKLSTHQCLSKTAPVTTVSTPPRTANAAPPVPAEKSCTLAQSAATASQQPPQGPGYYYQTLVLRPRECLTRTPFCGNQTHGSSRSPHRGSWAWGGRRRY